MRSKTIELSGWGRVHRASARAWRPERVRAVAEALGSAGEGGIIAHGAGRSYGDAPLNDSAILTCRLDRILSADWKAGEVVCEPGVAFADLMRLCLRHGFAVPVSPGTGFATIGGGIANDVHGKNHDRHGSLGDHVQWLDLMLPSGETQRVSPEQDPDLFAATIGGIGLTGVILGVCLKLRPAKSNAVELTEKRAPDLDSFLGLLEDARKSATYSVGWIDATARGRRLGRGILETAEEAGENLDPPKAKRRKLPMEMPGFALNRLTVGMFNAMYYRRVPTAGRRRTVPLDEFLYPLDAIEDWNRLYGKRGFHQFQCVLPDDGAAVGLRKMLEAISAAGSASFLAVLKTLGGEGRGHLSFPMRGHTLALDFPAKARTGELLATLERMTLDHGGRIYLAKDSVMSADGFAAMYPRLAEFRAVLDRIDPHRRMMSDMARRLNIRGDGA